MLVLGLTVVAVVYLLPTFVGGPLGVPFLPDKPIKLGLDLQGGTHLVLQVEVEKAVENSIDRMADQLKAELRRANVRVGKVERQAGYKLQVSFPNESREQFKQVLGEHFPALKAGDSQTEGADVLYQLSLDPKEVDRLRVDAVDRSLETIRNRIDEFGVAEAVIQRQGDRDVLVQLPGIQDPTRAKELIGKTAVLEFKLLRDGVNPEEYVENKKALPTGTQLLYGAKKDEFGNRRRGVPYIVENQSLLTGDVLTDARVQTGETPGTWVVAFTLDASGAKRFEDLTGANVGRRMAIVLDNVVDSAPQIRSRIPGGRGIIEGNFAVNEAKDLAIVLRSGALPAPVSIAEERTVGPSLGRDSIRQGIISFVVGGGLVVIFMVVYYKFAGVLADMALILNVTYLLAALTMFGATLTLPGLAGIVLTIGMAVDANVLINERIREELRLGKTARAAIQAGYERALPAILDTNMNSFLAGVILFQFGSGPVRGFAVTLCIGLVSSVFTAVIGTRVVYDYLLTYRRIQTVSV